MSRSPKVNTSQLERVLGAAQLEVARQHARGWYGNPIPIALPGSCITVDKDGDFHGRLNSGNLVEVLQARFRRLRKDFLKAVDAQANTFNTAGFSGLADMMQQNNQSGKRRSYLFRKTGTAGSASRAESLWRVGTIPAAAGASSNAPGGDALDNTSAGAININADQAISGDGEYFHQALAQTANSNFGLMFYDRLFQVNKTMNSTTAEAVTGVPTRYQSSVTTAQNFAGSNFLFIECQTVLSATAHNWTVCQYTNQAGTTGQTMPSLVGLSACPVNAFDMPTSQWFCPLAAGDTGLLALSQIQCDAAVATGAIAFVIGHVLGFIPAPLAQFVQFIGDANYNFGMARMFDGFCGALIEMPKSAANAITWNGNIQTVRGSS